MNSLVLYECILGALILALSIVLLYRLRSLARKDAIPFVRNEARHAYQSRLYSDYFWLKATYPLRFKPSAEVENILMRPSRDVKWADLYFAEKCIYSAAPLKFLAARWSALVSNFKRSAPEDEVALAADHGLLEPKVNPRYLPALTTELLDRIQRCRSVTIRRENTKNGVSFVVALFAFLLLAAILMLYLYVNQAPRALKDPPVLAVIILCGALGGFVSAQARIQAIPDTGHRVSDLSLVRISGGILLAIVTGAIGAVFLYASILGGLIKGELFPDVSSMTANSFAGFSSFLAGSDPLKNSDMAKLIIWSFAAGFSERLVPDQIFFLVSQVPSGRKPR